MKHPLTVPLLVLSAAIVFAAVTAAWLFRYEVRGVGGVRYDRWTGDVQILNAGEWKSLSEQ